MCPWGLMTTYESVARTNSGDSRTFTFRLGSRRTLKRQDQGLTAEFANFLMMEMLAGVSTLLLAPPQIACKFDVKRWPARTVKLFRRV